MGKMDVELHDVRPLDCLVGVRDIASIGGGFVVPNIVGVPVAQLAAIARPPAAEGSFFQSGARVVKTGG